MISQRERSEIVKCFEENNYESLVAVYEKLQSKLEGCKFIDKTVLCDLLHKGSLIREKSVERFVPSRVTENTVALR